VYKPKKCYSGYTLVRDREWWSLIDMGGRTQESKFSCGQ